MQTTQYIWKDGELVFWSKAKTHVLTHSLHYGSAVFEGIRCYKTANGPAVFKLAEHIQRFFYSAKQLNMKIRHSTEDLCQAIVETLYHNECEEGYIRPLAYYGYGSMKVTPDHNLPTEVIIACWPWGRYLSAEMVDIATSAYIRIHPRSTVANAKISGHYVNSILAGLAIAGSHYHDALLLDAEGYVAEASAANIFIVKNGKLITPPEGTILVGITRNTIIQIVNEMDLSVEERRFHPDEIYTADEAFLCGTAVEVVGIRSLDDRIIADGQAGMLTKRIQSRYQEIVHGQAEQYLDCLTPVRLNRSLAV